MFQSSIYYYKVTKKRKIYILNKQSSSMDSANKGVVIVAGTHPRENEFSHAVADRLIAQYGQKEPDHVFMGSDGAREGKLWVYDALAVAKINRLGETSPKYLSTLSRDDLEDLAFFQLSHTGCPLPPSIDDRFENRNQWTSVSQQIVDASNASTYVDLHSYHVFSSLNQTGLYILPDASALATARMKDCVAKARSDLPDVYGRSDRDPFADHKKYAQEILKSESVKALCGEHERLFDELKESLQGLDKSQLTNLLAGGAEGELTSVLSDLMRVSAQLLPYDNAGLSQMADHWGTEWHVIERKPYESGLDRFTFEAVHWKGRQQDAVVNFVEKYLVPK